MGASRLAKLNIVILVLASGRSERFLASGGKTHKLDTLFLHGKTVLEATVHQAEQTGLAVHIEKSNHAGMGDTIAAAVTATQGADGWLMLPADMPLVLPEVMLLVAKELNEVSVAAPEFEGFRGHPVGFSKVCLADLMALSGNQGAKQLFSKYEVKKINIDGLEGAQGCVLDIDTMQDLESLQKHGIFG